MNTTKRLGTAIATGALILAPLLGATAEAQQSVPAPRDTVDRQRIERIVRDYLLQNPEILIEMTERLQAKEQQLRQSQFRDVLSAHRSELFEDAASPVVGNPNGATVIIEFSDYNCPYCKRMAPIVRRAVEDNPDLKVILREFPILGPVSRYASRATLAARRQNKYEAFHWALILQKGTLTEAAVDNIAVSVGLDLDRLKQDMESPEIEKHIERNLALASRLGINGTPAFIAGETLVRGALPEQQFRDLLRSASSSDR